MQLSGFEKARAMQSSKEMPFLIAINQQMKQDKCYQGLKIIHNLPLSLETVLKLESLVLSGAELIVVAHSFLRPQSMPLALNLLKEMAIPVVLDHKSLQGEQCDFCLDCGAELDEILVIKSGHIELTQSGATKLQNKKNTIPVLSVNDSTTKRLETFFGTGEGFVRALKSLVTVNLSDLNVALFGFGKVGQGVAHFLKPLVKELNVIDPYEKARKLAVKLGHFAYDFNNFASVKQVIQKSSLIITATGQEEIISKYFNAEIFRDKILANIGAMDEFGDKFQEDEILNNKVPINFSLKDPTTFRYLDPSFYAHNIGPKIIIDHHLQPGFHPLPLSVDQSILKQWVNYHQQDISPILSDAQELTNSEVLV